MTDIAANSCLVDVYSLVTPVNSAVAVRACVGTPNGVRDLRDLRRLT